MSKYNDGHSIPIDSLSKDELKVAIKEWAEGSEIMEQLLWNLYNYGIKTSGCHYGIHPYVDFDYDENKKDIYIKIMNATLTVKGSQALLISDGSNPFSGPDWYKPHVGSSIFTDERSVGDNYLSLLNSSITNSEQINSDIDTSCLMDLLDRFKGTLTHTLFRVRHKDDDTFLFSVEKATEKDHELFIYFNNSLTPLGFTLREFEEGPHKNWEYIAKDTNELNKKMKETAKVLIDNYSYKTPTSIDGINDFTTKALILQRQLSDEDFKKWAKEEKEKL